MSIGEHQAMLDRADRAVGSMAERVRHEKFRNRFHFMAPAGWLNDPNGLIYYKGRYHMFYQHNPYAPVWGAMHWGHAVSGDLVHWEHLPIALAPSESYDDYEKGGCFSGCAVDNGGVLCLFFTACSEKGQSQCAAAGADGVHFTKYGKNPVVVSPPDCSPADFRDPKIWRHGGLWYMIVGTCRNEMGKAVLFRSANLADWDFAGTICGNDGTLGTMWECPDFFELGGKSILIFSPIGAEQAGAVFLTGSMRYEDADFRRESQGCVDHGDFYAPQTFLDSRGRRIMIGWLRNTMPRQDLDSLVRELHWCGSMSIPRIVDLGRDGRLRFTPYDGLRALRRGHAAVREKILTESKPLPVEAGDGLSYEMTAEFKLSDPGVTEIDIVLRASAEERTVVRLDVGASEIVLDRTRSDGCRQGNVRCPMERAEDGLLKIHLFVDASAIEIFANSGADVISGNIYPASDSRDAWLAVRGGSVTIREMHTWGLSAEADGKG